LVTNLFVELPRRKERKKKEERMYASDEKIRDYPEKKTVLPGIGKGKGPKKN